VNLERCSVLLRIYVQAKGARIPVGNGEVLLDLLRYGYSCPLLETLIPFLIARSLDAASAGLTIGGLLISATTSSSTVI
jgi:hypothetical protein